MMISAMVTARDAEATLDACLASLAGCTRISEIIVLIDDRTTDTSRDIAQGHASHVFEAPFRDYASFKNEGIGHCSAEWILILDSDEMLELALAEEIAALTLANPETSYAIPFKNHLRGRWMRFGGLYPDYHTRLVHRSQASYHGNVHESLGNPYQLVTLNHHILHYGYLSWGHLFEKCRHYARLERGHRGQSFLKAGAHGLRRFLTIYIKKGGLLDGIDGFVHAVALGYYQWVKYSG